VESGGEDELQQPLPSIPGPILSGRCIPCNLIVPLRRVRPLETIPFSSDSQIGSLSGTGALFREHHTFLRLVKNHQRSRNIGRDRLGCPDSLQCRLAAGEDPAAIFQRFQER